ncbi:T9SS C-terminal target domain-containing protein [Aquimarina sp. BL5]|uniref:cellulase family glycosylhydrolase n=1 Tax=Aquimarina sp. BL5 TaxID=1714860 RepID=UPI000E4678A8|nr:cellulase family glycosylhydrolase [Aquimarina sp. BL5]AXT51693.1 T9SS C-terminal target domain-containing protein [Aquimarina sp. BL5]RKN08785.1 T9SS C-terminal target domain-containing protein [Aquimarina sp. BL5]
MKSFYITLLCALLICINATSQTDNCEGNWLSTSGNKLLDSDGNEVILAGVNWFGFETQISIPHGLYARDIEGMLQQTKDLGFNCLRIPWHNMMLRDGATFQEANYWVKDPYTYDGTPENGPYSNLGLQGLTKPIEVMDYLIQWCQDNDMKVILDCHSRNPDAYLVEKLWYTENVSEEQWIEDWVFMTNRYKDFDAVIGMDINNEPNGKIDNPEGARWGTNDQYDWRLAAEKCGNAILAANPNVLIMVEGIEAYNKPDGTETSYWWGGNLQGARDFPVRLSDPTKLMYSPHEYGPTVFAQEWFTAADFPDNMPGIWEEQFNFLNTEGTSPLLIGELGIKGQGGLDEIWFQKFIDFIKEKKLHFTFWALNPNSGDTGGIFDNDWSTVVQWKMDYLQPILSNPIPNCSAGNVLSINDLSDISFSVYPNPATQIINFSFKEGTIASIGIYDLNGREISVLDDNEVLSSNSYTYDVSKLALGMYLSKVTLANSKETFTKKILIQ